MSKEDKLPTPEPDGLVAPEVGRWSETKYRLVSLYDTLFSSGMKNKWDKRVYIDLYAGAGYSRIKGTNRLVYGSPLLALMAENPFDKYIFCDDNSELIRALSERCKRIRPNTDIAFVEGDCNERVSDIIAEIPQGSKNSTVLSLCFVDPFNVGIKFSTISKLAQRFIDFLVLLALHMDANRNYSVYVQENSRKIDEFLGDKTWRNAWRQAAQNRNSFPHFLADQYAKSMTGLGYLPTPQMKEVERVKNSPLYRLAIFSRNERAYKFWKEVLKYTDDQIPMFPE